MSTVPVKNATDVDVLQDKWMTTVDGALLRIDDRVRSIERLVYIAFGGISVIGGGLALIGSRIINLLAK